MEARDSELVDEVVTDDLSAEEAVDQAGIEGDACEHVSEEGRVPSEEAEDFSSLGEEEIRALDELVRADDERRSVGAEARGLTPGQFLRPGGGWGGSEASVRRAIRIATDNGLTVTSTKRSILSSGSDHHVSQKMAFAADLSNGSSPTPQMDKTARDIARALGHPGWRGGGADDLPRRRSGAASVEDDPGWQPLQSRPLRSPALGSSDSRHADAHSALHARRGGRLDPAPTRGARLRTARRRRGLRSRYRCRGAPVPRRSRSGRRRHRRPRDTGGSRLIRASPSATAPRREAPSAAPQPRPRSSSAVMSG